MNRRDAVKKAFLLGSAVTATSLGVFNQGCSLVREREDRFFTEGQEEIVAEIADMLIPDNDIPGAKAAGMGSFIVMMISDCYPEDIQKKFVSGLIRVEKMSESMFNKPFAVITRTERGRILKELKQEAEGTKDAPPHFFKLIRELTFLGYFTSEIGATQALDYVQVPGRYEGCIPLKSGQRAWAI